MNNFYRDSEVAALAQLAERSLSKRKVGGSNPPCGSLFLVLTRLDLNY